MRLCPRVHFEDAVPRPAGTGAAGAGATATASAGATATVQVPPTLPAPGSPPLLPLPPRITGTAAQSAPRGWDTAGTAAAARAAPKPKLKLPPALWGRGKGGGWELSVPICSSPPSHSPAAPGKRGMDCSLVSKRSFTRDCLGLSWERTSWVKQTGPRKARPTFPQPAPNPGAAQPQRGAASAHRFPRPVERAPSSHTAEAERRAWPLSENAADLTEPICELTCESAPFSVQSCFSKTPLVLPD
ncbi:uncharacterized protein LOC123577124 [Leopardus geoffroyi]|uniref:uncharacterized protein LOC123577124 n=1 Tax=Leopardus geoffroyi TaxID=46844 RepID=UPI001E263C7B|nr:uncharacterized protein LOC123577124 [Leopardus geoffroyi]